MTESKVAPGDFDGGSGSASESRSSRAGDRPGIVGIVLAVVGSACAAMSPGVASSGDDAHL